MKYLFDFRMSTKSLLQSSNLNGYAIALCLFFGLGMLNPVQAQTCKELKDYVKSVDKGVTFTTYLNGSNSNVSFHEVKNDSIVDYYAIVRAESYQEVIFKVIRNTKMHYQNFYKGDPTRAFYNYIYPYRNVLGCDFRGIGR